MGSPSSLPTSANPPTRPGTTTSDRYGFDRFLPALVANRIRALDRLHRWDEATAADRELPGVDSPHRLPLLLYRADLRLRRGDTATAADLLTEATTPIERGNDPRWRIELATIQAALACQRQRWDEARTTVRRGLDLTLHTDEQHDTARLVALGIRIEADALDAARTSGARPDLDPARRSADQLLADGSEHQAALEATGAGRLPATTLTSPLPTATTELTTAATPTA